jgi:hypothetical protein
MDEWIPRWNPGHDVIIVDKTVHFYIKIVLEGLIAHSGRTECIDALEIIIFFVGRGEVF